MTGHVLYIIPQSYIVIDSCIAGYIVSYIVIVISLVRSSLHKGEWAEGRRRESLVPLPPSGEPGEQQRPGRSGGQREL